MSDDSYNLGPAIWVRDTATATLFRVEEDSPAASAGRPYNRDGTQFFDIWIPKSCVHDDSECYEEETGGDLLVKRWWAEKQDWFEP